MKRRISADGPEKNRKRPKLHRSYSDFSDGELFDFPERQRYVSSIVDQNIDSEPGYISGSIFMVDDGSGEEMRFTITVDGPKTGNGNRLQIVFGKNCARRLRMRNFVPKPSNEIFISLQECICIPGKLSNGVVGRLKFSKRVLVKMLSHGAQSKSDKKVLWNLWDSEKLEPSERADSDVSEVTAPLAPQPGYLNKKQRRYIRAMEHLEKQNRQLEERSHVPDPKAVSDAAVASASRPNAVVHSNALSKENKPLTEYSNGPLSLRAGRQCDTILLTPLAQVQRKNHTYNVAAIAVSDSSITKKHTGDYNCTLQLVDPSNRGRSDGSPLKANCFAKLNPHWLPNVRAGDIIVLKDAKGGGFNGGNNLVGYHDKLKWALYGPDGVLHHGAIPTDVPRDTLTDEGSRHSPFFQSNDSILLDYCSRLREWWDAIELDRKKAMEQTHQISKSLTTPPPERNSRPNLLIKDANTGIASNGYFNCIAEVLHTHRPDNGCYDIYITDYTSNSQCPDYEQAKWCPRGLSKFILKVELWDRAASFGPKMEVGKIYSFKNMRIRLANNGFYEAKMQELKIAELTTDNTGSTHPGLEKLLERKAKWAAKYKIVERLDQLEFTAIKDVEMRVRFNCVAEILHVSYTDGSSSAKVYVTDYTANDLLPDVDLDTDEFDHLHKRILKVILRDSQAAKARWLERGNICIFHKVIVKLFNRENVGDLGGDQRLIDRLNPGVESHKPLVERLESLKKNFYDANSKPKVSPAKVPQSRPVSDTVVKSESVSKPSKPRVLEPSGSANTPEPRPMICTSIQELINRKEPLVAFRIPARVSWVKPRKLENFVRRWCKNCKKHIPSEYKACVACDDTDHAFLDFKYHFNIWIEEDGEEGLGLPVMVWDDALFLRHMPRVDLVQDPEAVDVFRRWFETFAGNVIQFQDDHYDGIHTKLESPLLCFEGCRYEEDGKPVFRAVSVRAVDN